MYLNALCILEVPRKAIFSANVPSTTVNSGKMASRLIGLMIGIYGITGTVLNSIRRTSLHTKFRDSKDSVVESKNIDKTSSSHLECKVGSNGYNIHSMTEYELKVKLGGYSREASAFQHRAGLWTDLQYGIESTIKVKGSLDMNTA
jgi:hypothetical protein